jgi:polar amino acid transport system substrate-binding protein
VGIALRKEDDALRQRVNQALANIIKDGTYQKINDEFFKINLLTLK